ncbi:MAG: hypothetical protein IPI91_16905 [Flavobacteriales bacterium]|nr:hypothetical protein [Flavobacteriales bacterium]
MYRWLVIVLLGSYVCSITELHQLIKLPGLIAHYVEHAQEDADETILCFLADHYLSGSHKLQDSGHGSELPFHGDHDCTSHTVQIAVPMPPNTPVFTCSVSIPDPPVIDDMSYSFLLSDDVWQPPKA